LELNDIQDLPASSAGTSLAEGMGMRHSTMLALAVALTFAPRAHANKFAGPTSRWLTQHGFKAGQVLHEFAEDRIAKAWAKHDTGGGTDQPSYISGARKNAAGRTISGQVTILLQMA
jgi:hypothetical protein